mmetsp:Transcript_7286/g.16600  ORF Transcript_7286/g.16600 Transcript_7286/m.16600 type:complete len:362 (-) Transcript_7286:222-1307(-)
MKKKESRMVWCCSLNLKVLSVNLHQTDGTRALCTSSAGAAFARERSICSSNSPRLHRYCPLFAHVTSVTFDSPMRDTSSAPEKGLLRSIKCTRAAGGIAFFFNLRRARHCLSPTRSAFPPSAKGPPLCPGMYTGSNSTGIAALAATASGRGPLSMSRCRPLASTTPHANSTGSSSNVAGSTTRSLSTTRLMDKAPFHGTPGSSSWIGATRDSSAATSCGAYPAAYNDPLSAPADVPMTPLTSKPASSTAWRNPAWLAKARKPLLSTTSNAPCFCLTGRFAGADATLCCCCCCCCCCWSSSSSIHESALTAAAHVAADAFLLCVPPSLSSPGRLVSVSCVWFLRCVRIGAFVMRCFPTHGVA